MGMFDFLDPVFKALQYPQSVYSGAVGALNHVAPTEEMKQRNQGRSALDELKRGLAGGLTPSAVDAIDTSSLGGRAQAGVEDVLLDPLNFIGGIAKTGALGEKLGKLVEAGGTVGKLEDASKGEKLAQFTRRAYEGYKGGNQSPDAAIGSAFLAGPLESKVLPAISGKLKGFFPQSKTAAEIEDSLGALVKAEQPGNVGNVLNTNPLMEQEYQNALRTINEVPPWRAVEKFQGPPDTGDGLNTLLQNLGNGVPTGRATPELMAGRQELPSMPFAMPAAPKSTAIERAIQPMQGIERVPTGPTPGFNLPQQPAGELLPGPGAPTPMGPVPPNYQPYMARNPQMELPPELLQAMSQGNSLPKQLGAGPGFERPTLPGRDNRFPPNRQRGGGSQLEDFLLSLIQGG